jgi:hypothetical protein
MVSMGRDRNRKGHDTSRDSGPFLALPCVVLDSQAYLSLSHPAKALLLEIARQYVRDNNGRLLASRAFLAKRGWKSADTITRALRELIAAKLIHQTVQGHRPNKASWFAVTWRTLDRLPGYDAGAAESFERGAYANQLLKNTSLKPSHGTETLIIGPLAGLERGAPIPPAGPIKALTSKSPRPPDGHHLDKPSTVTELEACQQPGNYKRLSAPVDGREWLPTDGLQREGVPLSVTRKALKQLVTLPNNGPVALVAIQAARSAGVSLNELTAWADTDSVARALANGTRPIQDLWTAKLIEKTQ